MSTDHGQSCVTLCIITTLAFEDKLHLPRDGKAAVDQACRNPRQLIENGDKTAYCQLFSSKLPALSPQTPRS
jgi:hypothetical protein